MFALVLGAAYLMMGGLGFILPLLSEDLPGTMGAPDGSLLGILAVGPFLTVTHILTGTAGLTVCKSYRDSKVYALVTGIGYLALFLLEVLSGSAGVLGSLLPSGGANAGLHFLTGFFALQVYAHW